MSDSEDCDIYMECDDELDPVEEYEMVAGSLCDAVKEQIKSDKDCVFLKLLDYRNLAKHANNWARDTHDTVYRWGEEQYWSIRLSEQLLAGAIRRFEGYMSLVVLQEGEPWVPPADVRLVWKAWSIRTQKWCKEAVWNKREKLAYPFMELSPEDLKQKEEKSRALWAKLTRGDTYDLFSPDTKYAPPRWDNHEGQFRTSLTVAQLRTDIRWIRKLSTLFPRWNEEEWVQERVVPYARWWVMNNLGLHDETLYNGDVDYVSWGGMFVAERLGPPKIDVDLLWHTHMMTGITYMDRNKKVFGAVMHHAPKRDSSTAAERQAQFVSANGEWEAETHALYPDVFRACAIALCTALRVGDGHVLPPEMVQEILRRSSEDRWWWEV